MSEIQDKMIRKVTCEQMYVELDLSIVECAKVTGVSIKTVYRWIAEGKWNEKKLESPTPYLDIYRCPLH